MNAIASQITSLTIVYSIVYSHADQRKHQSSASLAFVRGIHRGLVNSPHKWPVTRKNVSIWWRHHGVLGSSPTLGWRLRNQLPSFHYFPVFKIIKTFIIKTLVTYWISSSWQVFPRLRCCDTCQILMWLNNLTGTVMRSKIHPTEKLTNRNSHDDVIKWKHFPRYWPFEQGIHWSTVYSPHKG